MKDRRQVLMDDVGDANRTSREAPTPGSAKLEQFRALAGCFAITSVYVSTPSVRSEIIWGI